MALIGSVIPSLEAQESGKICLTFNEFKYYAGVLIERNGLISDTANLNAQILAADNFSQTQAQKIGDLRLIQANKDTIIGKWKDSFTSLEKRCKKTESKWHLYRKTTVLFFFTTLVFGSIVIAK